MAQHTPAPSETSKIIATMIRQGRASDEISAATGVKEHFILAEMKARADAPVEREG